jgi:hypothetical protein
MRFSLRTLLILMLLGGPLGAWGWKKWQAYRARVAEAEEAHEVRGVRWKSCGGGVTTVTTIVSGQSSAAADEIWEQQRDRITWESFPESQPPRP